MIDFLKGQVREMGLAKVALLDVARSYSIVSHYSGRLDRLNGSFVEIESKSGLTAKNISGG